MSLPVVPVCLLDFLKVWGYRDTFNGNTDRKNMTFNAKSCWPFPKYHTLSCQVIATGKEGVLFK